LYLGRLAIIAEPRQKSRVIGISDYWSQVLLKPLHDELASRLSKIPEDGTFNQGAPLDLMKKGRENLVKLNNPTLVHPLYSLDLSAATDRLPVHLQADILTALGLDGKLWKDLVTRPYWNSHTNEEIQYSVGQAMGIYSSFTMLGLSNHIIMIAAMHNVHATYLSGTGQYGILGDDAASALSQVANEYTKILQQLGVEVNPIKGFTGDLIEFAKRLFYFTGETLVEVSPIGMKALVQTIRNPLYLSSVLSDMDKKSYLFDDVLSMCIKIYIRLFQKKLPQVYKYTLALLGPQGGLWQIGSMSSSTSYEVIRKQWERLLTEILRLEVSDYAKMQNILLKKRALGPISLSREIKVFWTTLCSLSVPLLWSRKEFMSLPKYAQAVLVALTLQGVLIIGFPVLIVKFLRKFTKLLVIEIVKMIKRDKDISIFTLLYFPEFNGSAKSINWFSLIQRIFSAHLSDIDHWSLQEELFRVLGENKIEWSDQIVFSLFVQHLETPINLMAQKQSVVGVIDQIPAVKTAERIMLHSPYWSSEINKINRALRVQKHNRRVKFSSKKNS